MTWRVVVASIECGPAGSYNSFAPASISNRFTQSQFTGMDKLTTITTRGVSRFRADSLSRAGQVADFCRAQCIPGLPLGFQRQAVQVQVSPDGLTLLWTVTDEELFTSIRATNDPIRGTVERFEAAFLISTMGPDSGTIPGAYLMGQFHGTAMGSKNSSRSAMFSWLTHLAIERMALPIGQVDPATLPTVMKVTWHEDIHQPFVTLDIDVKFPPGKAGKQGFGIMRVDLLGVDIIKMYANNGQNPQMPGNNKTRGTANLVAFASLIKEACGAVPPLTYQSYGSRGSAADNDTASTVDVQVTSFDDLPDSATNYSADVTRGTYTEMSVQSKWETSQGNMAVPIAGKPPQQPYRQVTGGSSSGSSGGSDDTASNDQSTVEVLTLRLPQTTLTVTYKAERCNVPPIITNANSTDSNLVLLREVVSPVAVSLDTDGYSPVFRIGGTLTDAAKSVRKAGVAINFGVAPFTSFSDSDTMAQLGPDSMVNGIDGPESTADDPGGAVACRPSLDGLRSAHHVKDPR